MKEFGVQLYSVRDTFRRLREMGYTQVQTAGCEIPFADFGRIAAEEGLEIVGTHEDFTSSFLAEKEGFEPSIPFWGIHDFQSCALGQLRDFSKWIALQSA